MFEYMTPAEKTAGIVNALISILLSPAAGLLIALIMFIVGMIRGGDYGFAKTCFIGFLIGLVFWIVVTAVLGVAYWDQIIEWVEEHTKEAANVLFA